MRRLSKTGDPATKAEAIRAVGHAQMTLASGELLRALSDPSPAVRRQAARALGRLDDANAAWSLIRFVRDNRELVEEETLEALGDMGASDAVAVVSVFLNDPRSPMRRQAAKTLGRLGSMDALGPLESAAADPGDPELRRAAVQALRTLNATEASVVIGRALQDPHPSVRAAAAEAVSEMCLTELGDEVRAALRVYGDSYSSELVYALGAIGGPDDLPAILDMSARASSPTTRRRCLLGAARLLGVEHSLYKLFNLEGLSRDQELVQALKPAYQRSKRLRDAVQSFSLGHEREALHMLSGTRIAKELVHFADRDVPELFLIAALAYAAHG